jgi:hypothetical protein
LQAWSRAEMTLKKKTLSDIVSLHAMGPVTNATVVGDTGTHVLTNVLNDWGCCSCRKAIQQTICYHQVLALIASYPTVGTIDFSDSLLRWAGRKFGADTYCHRGPGGMQPLSDRLKDLTVAAIQRQGIPKAVAPAATTAPTVRVPQASGIPQQEQASTLKPSERRQVAHNVHDAPQVSFQSVLHQHSGK